MLKCDREMMDQNVPDISAAGGSCYHVFSQRGSCVSNLFTFTFTLETTKLIYLHDTMRINFKWSETYVSMQNKIMVLIIDDKDFSKKPSG